VIDGFGVGRLWGDGKGLTEKFWTVEGVDRSLEGRFIVTHCYEDDPFCNFGTFARRCVLTSMVLQ